MNGKLNHALNQKRDFEAEKYDLPLVQQGCTGCGPLLRATFPNSEVTAVHKAPGDYPGGKEGDVLTVEFKVLGIPCLGLNGGPEFKHSEAFSFQIATDNQEETDRFWNAIVANGGKKVSAVGARTAGASLGRSPRAL